MKVARTAFVYAVVAGALVSGCDRVDCCLIDITSHAVVRGLIESSPGIPASEARLEPIGVLGYQCNEDTNPLWVPGDSAALVGSDGTVMLTVVTADGPGNHCMDLVVTEKDGVRTDTMQDVEVEFRLLEEVPDTVDIHVVITG